MTLVEVRAWLNGLTPYEYIAKIWTSKPERFIINPIHQMPGLNTQMLGLNIQTPLCPSAQSRSQLAMDLEHMGGFVEIVVPMEATPAPYVGMPVRLDTGSLQGDFIVAEEPVETDGGWLIQLAEKPEEDVSPR